MKPTISLGELALSEAEASLDDAMKCLAPPAIQLACRAIRAGDESRLLPGERLAITTRNPAARRESAAARIAARKLMIKIGAADLTIGREHGGQPVWPTGVIGSLAHDREMAVATVASSANSFSLGIDIEPAEPLPAELDHIVLTKRDDLGSTGCSLAGRLVFAAKEAVYKACYPLDGAFLNYHDVYVSLRDGSAATSTGRIAKIVWCSSPRIVVLAIIQHGATARPIVTIGRKF